MNCSHADAGEPSVPISESKSENGTLQDLLALGRDRRKDVLYFYPKSRVL